MHLLQQVSIEMASGLRPRQKRGGIHDDRHSVPSNHLFSRTIFPFRSSIHSCQLPITRQFIDQISYLKNQANTFSDDFDGLLEVLVMNMVETRSSRRRPRESDDQEAGDPDLVSRGYSTEESHREHERYPLSPGTTQREIQEYLIPRARKSQRLHAGGRTGEAGERMIIDNEIEEVSVTGRGPQTGGKREMREEVGRTKRQLEVDSSGRGSGVGHRGARRELKSSMSGRRRDGKQLVISTGAIYGDVRLEVLGAGWVCKGGGV